MLEWSRIQEEQIKTIELNESKLNNLMYATH